MKKGIEYPYHNELTPISASGAVILTMTQASKVFKVSSKTIYRWLDMKSTPRYLSATLLTLEGEVDRETYTQMDYFHRTAEEYRKEDGSGAVLVIGSASMLNVVRDYMLTASADDKIHIPPTVAFPASYVAMHSQLPNEYSVTCNEHVPLVQLKAGDFDKWMRQEKLSLYADDRTRVIVFTRKFADLNPLFMDMIEAMGCKRYVITDNYSVLYTGNDLATAVSDQERSDNEKASRGQPSFSAITKQMEQLQRQLGQLVNANNP